MIELDESGQAPRSRLKDRLADPRPLLAVELRPPRRDLRGSAGMEAWIDVYHAVHRLSRLDTVVFLTDNAVGSDEEENLSHLVRNLGPDAVRERVVPFLTLKHPLEYCLRYAERSRRESFPALVVLGGDRHDGIPRCLPHARELRALLRSRLPGGLLGGWVNPYRDPAEQVGFLAQEGEGLDFALTQIVSQHGLGPVEAFLSEASRQALELPLFAGVFLYRSARRRTLDMLSRFIPVPRAGVERDFRERGLSSDEVAAETLRALGALGFSRFYLSNLETGRVLPRLRSIAGLAGLPEPRPDPAGRRPRR
jgi:hypothetical protein